LPVRALRLGVLGRPRRLDPRPPARAADDLAGGPRPPLLDGRPGRGGRADRRVLRATLRARAHCGRAQGGRAMRLRDLPSVDELARELDDPLAVEAARAVLSQARDAIDTVSDTAEL